MVQDPSLMVYASVARLRWWSGFSWGVLIGIVAVLVGVAVWFGGE